MLIYKENFLRTLFGSFFKWWWAIFTGFASVLSWVLAPDGLTLNRVEFTSLTLVGMMLAFFALSTIYQGWRIYRNRLQAATVIGYQKSDSYGGEYVFIIKGVHKSAQGKIAELRRPVNGVEVPFAVVEFVDFNSQGYYQANPVWVSANQLRELRTGKFAISEVVVDLLISHRTLLIARIGHTA